MNSVDDELVEMAILLLMSTDEYRILHPDELVQKGDEFRRRNDKSAVWKPSNNWMNHSKKQCSGFEYRRRRV